jgi:hypothetical protein
MNKQLTHWYRGLIHKFMGWLDSPGDRFFNPAPVVPVLSLIMMIMLNRIWFAPINSPKIALLNIINPINIINPKLRALKRTQCILYRNTKA